MAFTWANTFVAPTSFTGFTSGLVTAIDEWPFSHADTAYIQLSSLASGTVTFTFNMSLGPGDKKGFRWWMGTYVLDVAGIRVTSIRVKSGTTLLATQATPWADIVNITAASHKMLVWDIPDSAWASDPAISDIKIEMDLTNLRSGNNRLFFAGVRLSKSPFTAAQEATLPADLAGQDFAVYRASDLGVLGAADGETVVVWPDASGKGRHEVQQQVLTTAATYKTGSPAYIEYPIASGTRFTGVWGRAPLSAPSLRHAYVYPYSLIAGGRTPVITSHASDYYFMPASVGDKHVLGIDPNDLAGGIPGWVIMSGDGSIAAHKHGGTPVQDAWNRVTSWTQLGGGNEKAWEDDDASPVINEESGSNSMYTYSIGSREDFNAPRHWEGRMAEVWFIDATGVTEAEIDGARDEWVNGPGGGGPSGGSEAAVEVNDEGAGFKTVAVGSDAVVNVDDEGAGQKVASGGSTAVVNVDDEGAGQRVSSFGVTALVNVDDEGAGRKTASGGATVLVNVDDEGSGSKVAASGATTVVEAVATGTGRKTSAVGGATTIVEVVVAGAGLPGGAIGGGATATVEVDDSGAGVKRAAGGATTIVGVDDQGAGVKTVANGATTIVEVDDQGGGRKTLVNGGATTIVGVDDQGAGAKTGRSGVTAIVEVVATGLGGAFVNPTGGSTAIVSVVSTGVGGRVVTGGSTATVEVAAAATGIKRGVNGNQAVLLVLVTGAGMRLREGGATAIVEVVALPLPVPVRFTNLIVHPDMVLVAAGVTGVVSEPIRTVRTH